MRHQRPSDRDHLLLASGERARALLLALGESREERVDALEVASRGYVLETGTVALADDAKALLRNEQVRKTYLGETD